ncbi:MAG: histidine kinase [Saprospiraceae bacterium]
MRYSLMEGLPQSQVICALSDTLGFLWFGTDGGGLSRFSGQEFKTFTVRDGLSSNYIRRLQELPSGQLLVATDSGLDRYDRRGGFKNLWQQSGIQAIYSLNDSTVWLGLEEGLRKLNLNTGEVSRIRYLPPGMGNASINDFSLVNGILYVATGKGLFYLKDLEWRWLNADNGLGANFVQFVSPDPRGGTGLWVFTFSAGIYTYQPGDTLVGDRIEVPLRTYGRPMSRLAGPDGTLWIGTQDQGLFIYDAKKSTWLQLNEAEGLPYPFISDIVDDRWGNRWVATSGGGVAKYLGRFFVHYPNPIPGRGNRIYSITQRKDSTIWFATSSQGLGRLSRGIFRPITADRGQLNYKVESLFEDNRRRVWASTEGGGVGVFVGNDFTLLGRDNNLPSLYVRGVLQDRTGRIYLATHNSGLAELNFRDSTWTARRIATKEGLEDFRITCFYRDPGGRLWLGSSRGRVAYLTDQGRVNYLTDPTGEDRFGPRIHSMRRDSADRIWLATAGKGVLRLDISGGVDSQTVVTAVENLSSSNFYQLEFDGDGYLWAGSNNGVDRIELNPEGNVVGVRYFGRSEGFLGIETCRDAALRDYSGNIWFGTLGGLTRHSPATQLRERAPPRLYFADIELFYQSLAETEYSDYFAGPYGIKEDLALPPEEDHISFSFRALDPNESEPILYSWQLEGRDADWAPFTERNNVSYTELPPGKYVFRVRALARGSGQESAELSAPFTIQTPIWRRIWFQLLFTLALVLGIVTTFFIRLRALRSREARRREELETRNRLLELEQQALRLQMNPHFIFNALTSIQSLVVGGDRTLARRQITEFAALMRSTLDHSRKDRITLAEEVAGLKNYLTVEQYSRARPFTFNIIVDPSLVMDEVTLPPMLIQPFVENALIHGLRDQREDGKVEVFFRPADEELLLVYVRDNGIGREQAGEIRRKERPGHRSAAIDVTRERLETLRGDEPYESLVYRDLQDEDGVPAGTEVRLVLPLEWAY